LALISLVLLDDHPIVLRGLSDLFSGEPGFEVLAACASAADAIRAVREFSPNVLVLDLRLPDADGLAVIRTLRSEHVATRMIILSAFIDDNTVIEALRLGAAGIVVKDSPPADLVECVRRVHAGQVWFDSQVMAGSLARTAQSGEAWKAVRATLTAREIEIIRMVSQGLRNKAVADRLGVSEGTVKVHIHNVYR
jgi:DNA-binding NarL/FixJ family response regulator